MTFLIPRPIRDIVSIRENSSSSVRVQKTEVLSRSQLRMYIWCQEMSNYFPKERVSCAAFRIALAASAALVLSAASGKTIVLATVLGSFISLPTVMIVAGSYLLCQGITALVASIAAMHFSIICFAAANCVVGWLTLEYYNIVPFGMNI